MSSEIKLIPSGLIEILRSPQIQAVVNQEAEAIAGRANHAEVTQHMTAKRFKATVKQNATSKDMDENNLAKAVRQ